MRVIYISAFFLLLCTNISFAQQFFGPQINCDHSQCNGLEAEYDDKFSFIPPPEGFEFGGTRDAVISVTYNGFPAQAQSAFQYAVDIWASILESNVPITINATWSNIGGSVLGFAGANDYERNFNGAPQSNVWYPAALANKLANTDLNPFSSDISCTFNSGTNWYFGTDGNTPGGQFDLVSVVLHELGHGLGCIGGSSYNNGTGTYGFSGTPVIWDTYIENGSGVDLDAFSSPSTSLGGQLTGNSLFWNGSNGILGLNGDQPRIYAPNNWNGGSSYSHLNESTYSFGNENSLMTPFIGSAEAIHDPGPAMRGMFQDMGWEIFPECDITDVSVVSTTPCNGTTGEFDQTIRVTYENEPETGFLLVNGVAYNITSSPQDINLTYTANSQLISYDVRFSANQDCIYLTGNIFTAPPPCCSTIKLVAVDPANKQFTVSNFGTCTESLIPYRLKSENAVFLFNNLTLVSGSYDILPNTTSVFQWDSWNPSPAGSDLALFVPFGDFNNPFDIRDYVQWKAPLGIAENVAVSAGIWQSGGFITDDGPYTFNGGATDFGVAFWSGVTPPDPCAVLSVTLGSSTGCNVINQTFSQELIISYENGPGSGFLNVNGQSFGISGSPQIIDLTGLTPDGAAVNVDVSFSEDMTCSAFYTALFNAAESCLCAYDFDSDGLVAVNDLTTILGEIGCSSNCVSDLTGDGLVAVEDLTVFLQSFGTICIP